VEGKVQKGEKNWKKTTGRGRWGHFWTHEGIGEKDGLHAFRIGKMPGVGKGGRSSRKGNGRKKPRLRKREGGTLGHQEGRVKWEVRKWLGRESCQSRGQSCSRTSREKYVRHDRLRESL